MAFLNEDISKQIKAVFEPMKKNVKDTWRKWQPLATSFLLRYTM